MAIDTTRIDTGPANVYLLSGVLSGTVTTAGSAAIVGVGTKFTTELAPNDVLYVVGEPAGIGILSITDDTHLTLKSVASTSASGKAITADVSVGGIKDGVEVQTETMTYDKTVDQLGDSVIDSVVSGKKATVTFGLAEWKLENLKRAIPESAAIIVTGVKRRFEVTATAGLSLLSIATRLTIKPILDGGTETTDLERTLVFPVAAPSAETLSLKFDPKSQRPIKATFRAFPDTAANRYRLFYVGDPTA